VSTPSESVPSATGAVAQSMREAEPSSKPQEGKRTLRDWLELAAATRPYAWGASVGALYLCGFLVLNGNLARFGVADFELVSGRYFLAGANFAFFVLCFYFFLGRALFLGQTWLNKSMKKIENHPAKNFWAFVALAEFLSTFGFFACLSAATYVGIALGQWQVTPFWLLVGLKFVVGYTLDITDLDIKNPRTNLVVELVLQTVSIVAFASLPSSDPFVVLGIYFGSAMYINMVLDAFARRTNSVDLRMFSAIHGTFVVLATALIFGSTLYGKVSSKVGGGRPYAVEVKLSEKGKEGLNSVLASEGTRGRLIYQTDKYIFLDRENDTVRLRTEDIAVLVLHKDPPDPTGVRLFGMDLGASASSASGVKASSAASGAGAASGPSATKSSQGTADVPARTSSASSAS